MKSTILILLILFIGGAAIASNPYNYPKATKVIIVKNKRRLYLVHHSMVYKEYKISLGQNPLGHKQMEGDSKTPEGEYRIDWRNSSSKYHLSLHISYPNEQDKKNANTKGVSPGGNIMIHGLPNDLGILSEFLDNYDLDDEWIKKVIHLFDWTQGCIAVNDEDIEQIWELVPDGTPIFILP
ncbi:MAG: L,D-transpeptidase family protein [Bacteriovoracaceae bacterium]|nr:L,D-transpeptidase family protein [Bacteriovoracaceae bacterium]